MLAVPLVVLLARANYWQFSQVIEFRASFLTTLTGLSVLAIFLLWMDGRPLWPRRMIASRTQWLAVAILVVVGAAARLYRFDVYPPADGQLWEEAQLGATVYSAIIEGGLDSYFPLPSLTAEAGFRWLGIDMRALRVPFVILGIASVPVFFVAARLFFRSFFAAWFATGLFATSDLLAAAARIAFESMSPVLTECIALAATFYACTRRSRAAFALAGLANGLILIENFTFKSVPLYSGILLITLLPRATLAPYCTGVEGPWRLRQFVRWLPYLVLALVFGLQMILPVILADPSAPLMPFMEGFLRHRTALDRAAAEQSTMEILWQAIGRVADMATFVFVGGGGGDDLLPATQGVIEFFTGVLGCAAVIYCLRGAWRSPAKLFVVISIILTVVLSGVLAQNPSRYRLFALVPIWFLGIGIAVDDLLVALPRYQTALAAALVGVLVVLAGLNAHHLFVTAIADKEVRINFYDICMYLAKEIDSRQRQDPRATVYLLTHQPQLAEVNDYYFLYDHHRVKVVQSVAEIGDGGGFLVADNEYVEPAASFSGASDCRRWESPFTEDKIVSCRLGAQIP